MHNGSDAVQGQRLKFKLTETATKVSDWQTHETDGNSTAKALKNEPTLESQPTESGLELTAPTWQQN